jgi:hypothetical protein
MPKKGLAIALSGRTAFAFRYGAISKITAIA